MNPEGEVAGSSVPLPVRLFRTRFDKLLLLLAEGEQEKASATANDLIQMIAILPEQNVNVRPHLLALKEYQEPDAWMQLSEKAILSLFQRLPEE